MGLSYAIGKAGFQVLFRCYFRGSVHHAENVPREGPFLIASNHASFLDPPMVGQGIPRQICFMARKTLFRHFPIGSLLRSWKAIPIDREGGDVGAIRGILDALKRGEGVMLFPEGTRTRDGNLQVAKLGTGFLVAKAGVPVVPARIWGSYDAMGRGKSLPRPRKLHVTFGKPLRFDASKIARTDRQEFYQRITDEIMAAIAELKPEG